MTTHRYTTSLSWEGSTQDYRRYDRTHVVRAHGNELQLSADPAFRGDGSLLNPELLVVAAASSCQLLSFLAVAARAGVEVRGYADDAEGVMPDDDPPTRITRITLRPRVVVRDADIEKVVRLLERAHEECYVARSLSGEVVLEPQVEVV